MSADATASLQFAMAEDRLRPGKIIRDGRIHRFRAQRKSTGDSGWYMAPERTNAIFGDRASGLKQTWKTDETTKPDKQTLAEWKAEQKRRDEKKWAARREMKG